MCKRMFIGIVAFILLYVIAAFVFSIIPVNNHCNKTQGDIDIYILSNDVHTDIVLPARNAYKDWTCQLRYEHTKANDTNMGYIAFGWGDKGFYLETPQWSDLKFSTAFKAMFYLGTSAMHCSFYPRLQEGAHCRKISIDEKEYKQLVAYIEESFQCNDGGGVRHIAGKSYGSNDAFYEAKRVYNLFYTCNTWANSALKSCGQKACLWTPSDKGIFYHY